MIRVNEMKIAMTAPAALRILWKEKVFFEAKSVNVIKRELEKHGYNFTDKNLMMALKNAKFLTRRGEKGDYSYVQKHPYVESEINVRVRKNK